MQNYKIPESLIPDNEEERLKHLHRYDILDTPPENAFERISQLAAMIFEVPVAQVNFVDDKRVFLKSDLSPFEFTELPREVSFCSLTILGSGTTVFNDTALIPDLQTNPMVMMENGVRFYAGAQVRTADGYPIGSVCVLDSVPREPTQKQLDMLKILSEVVIDELELRLAARKTVKLQTDILNILAHDLKNPLNTITLTSQMIAKKNDSDQSIKTMTNRINTSSEEIQKRLLNFVNISKIENGSIELKIEPCYYPELMYNLKSNFDLIAEQKQQIIEINNEYKGKINVDKALIQDAFENLLSNAIKYSPFGKTIKINTSEEAEHLLIEFKDDGQGLTEEDKKKLFFKFAKLSAIPTAKERSNGLGLSIVKMLIEMHNGQVWANSDGKDLGTSFFVRIKK